MEGQSKYSIVPTFSKRGYKCYGPKFSDKQVWANSVDPDQAAQIVMQQSLNWRYMMYMLNISLNL